MKTQATEVPLLEPLHGTRLPRALISAYMNAHYQIGRGPEAIPFRIGVRCPALEQLLRRQGVARAAFLTACNPWGRPLNSFANRRLQVALARHLRERGLSWLPGFGCGPDWPAEPSATVFGVDRHVGDQIARRFRQQGWVLLGANLAPRLVLLR